MHLPDLIERDNANLSERVYLTLKEAILSLVLKPREYLVIGDLATFYEISRTPVRDAIIKLQRDGLVEQDGRRGARVTAPSEKQIMEIVESQAALEAYMVSKIAKIGLSEEKIEQIEKLFKEEEAFIENGDIENSRKLSKEFHSGLYDWLGNDYMSFLVEELEEKVIRVRKMIWNTGDAPLKETLEQHREIFEMITQRNANRAYELMIHHTMWYEEEIIKALKHL